MPEETFNSLSCVGAQLVKLQFLGNGKHSEVLLRARHHRKIIMPPRDARMDLSLSGPMSIRMEGWGDTEVVREIAPTAEQVIRIEDAAIDLPAAEWKEAFRSFPEEERLDWAVTLRLKPSCDA